MNTEANGTAARGQPEAGRNIRGSIRGFIEGQLLFGRAAPGLGDEDSLTENHVLDSTGFLELVMFLEAEFGVKVRDEELLPENLDSIARLERFVLERMKHTH